MALAVRITTGETWVSGLFETPPGALACLVLAHGAGAGMTHPFLESVADGLAARGVATLRYQFPFMEAGSRRPDRPAAAMNCVRAAIAEALRLAPDYVLFAGGKSFGGRMTGLAAASGALPDVRGLVFLGFPLHPAGRPSLERASHLSDVPAPMLFIQGTRDALADRSLIEPVVRQLGGRARLVMVDGADHSFHVPVRSGRTDAAVLAEVLDEVAAWIRCVREEVGD